MTPPSRNIEIFPGSVTTLSQLAQEAQIDAPALVDQSFRLCLFVAGWAVRTQAQPSMMFERPNGEYGTIPFEFVPMRTQQPPLPPELAQLDPDTNKSPVKIPVDPSLYELTLSVAKQLFDVSQESFLNTGIFYRWHWSLARKAGAKILLDPDSSDREYVVLHDDAPLYFDPLNGQSID